jgi:hypothetical protein
MRLCSSVTRHQRIYWGAGQGSRSDVWDLIFIGYPTNIVLYIHRLTDEYISFIFFTAIYFGCLPGRGASKIGRLYKNVYTAARHSSSRQ